MWVASAVAGGWLVGQRCVSTWQEAFSERFARITKSAQFDGM